MKKWMWIVLQPNLDESSHLVFRGHKIPWSYYNSIMILNTISLDFLVDFVAGILFFFNCKNLGLKCKNQLIPQWVCFTLLNLKFFNSENAKNKRMCSHLGPMAQATRECWMNWNRGLKWGNRLWPVTSFLAHGKNHIPMNFAWNFEWMYEKI